MSPVHGNYPRPPLVAHRPLPFAERSVSSTLREIFKVSSKTPLVHLGLEHILKENSLVLKFISFFHLIEMLSFQMIPLLSPVWTQQLFFIDDILKNFVDTNKMNVLFRLAMANLSEMQKSK